MTDTPPVAVRHLDPWDNRAATDLLHASLRDAYAGLLPDGRITALAAAAAADLGDGRWAGAFAGPRLLGVAQTRPATGLLDRLYVRPGAHRRGVGTLLLADAETHAAAHGTPLWLWVLSTNPARRFYEARGYAPTGETRNLTGLPGHADLRYENTRSSRPRRTIGSAASRGGSGRVRTTSVIK